MSSDLVMRDADPEGIPFPFPFPFPFPVCVKEANCFGLSKETSFW